MSLFSIFSRKRPEPKREPLLPRFSHTYKVQGEKLVIEAPTLDAFYAAESTRYSAENMLDMVVQAEKLKSRDNTKADFDPRPNHIVLPSKGFEFHGDTGKFTANSHSHNVSGDSVMAKVEGKSIHVDQEPNTGLWNRQKGDFNFQFCAPGPVTKDFSRKRTAQICDGIFMVGPDGKIAKPGAQSLAEAKSVQPKRESAQRAQALMTAAQIWEPTCAEFDSSKVDINPKKGVTVAPNVARTALSAALSKELIMSSTAKWVGDMEYERVPYKEFDLQHSPEGFIVAGGWEGYGARLTGSQTEQGLNLTFQDDESHVGEELVWSKQDGTVHYQKFKIAGVWE